jgi:tetratricopeptide (TPR) repeat protein
MMVAMARHDRALLPLAILAPLVAADCGHRPRAVATVGRSDDVISVGRRTLAVETEAVLAEDGKLHEESVLRLGGDLAVAATAAIGVGGKRGEERILDLAHFVLGPEALALAGKPTRLGDGQIEVRVARDGASIQLLRGRRMIAPALGFKAALAAALTPMATEGPARPPPFPSGPPSGGGRLPGARVERRYTLTVPDGFASSAPPDVDLGRGSVALERHFHTDGSRVQGSLHYEVPTEALATKDAFAAVHPSLTAAQLEAEPRLEVEMIAETLLGRGRLADAVAETRRLVSAHPGSAYYHGQHASMLLAAGLVETARAEARRGTELDPQLPFSWQVLATTLESDRFGRRFGRGYDRAGAVEARRRQSSLTGPKGRGPYELALLMAHDDRGRFLDGEPPLRAIVDLCREVESPFRDEAMDLRAHSLLLLGRPVQAEPLAREVNQHLSRPGLLLAAIALAHGADAAIAEVPRLLLGDSRAASALMAAVRTIMVARAHGLAAPLAAEAARLDAAFKRSADVATRLRPHAEREDDQRPAARVVRRLQSACSSPEAFAALGGELLDPRSSGAANASGEAVFDTICTALLPGRPWPASDCDIDWETATTLDVAGDAAAGYRVRRADAPLAVQAASTVYLTGGPQPRLLGPDVTVAATEAFRLAVAGKTKEAATWLEWLREAMAGPGDVSTGSYAVWRETIRALWSERQPRLPGAAAEAAAALAVYRPGGAPEVFAVLGSAYASESAPRRRRALLIALVEGRLVTGEASEARRLALTLTGSHEQDTEGVGIRTWAVTTAADCPRAVATMSRWANAHDDPRAWSWQTAVAGRCGASAEAISAARKLVSGDRTDPVEHNKLAWYLMMAGQDGSEAVAQARRAVEMTARRVRTYLATLAYALAQSDDLSQARGTLVESLDPSGRALEEAWLTTGTIAERLGYPAEALAAYRRIRDPGTRGAQGSVWSIAQRRIAVVDGTPRPAGQDGRLRQ